MLLDVQLERGVVTAAATAARAERAGFSGVWAAEVTRDPMLSLAAASTSTKHITLGSNVVLAFARNPMSVAQQAWDLAEATRGRFLLGLATQVKPHITRRYSMPFTDPVGRMRDFVLAVRHIHEVFMGKHPMDYRGSHYSHTLLRRWDELAGLVDDAMLDHFALRGTLEELPARIRTRYGDYYDRAVPYLPLERVDLDRLRQFTSAVMAD